MDQKKIKKSCPFWRARGCGGEGCFAFVEGRFCTLIKVDIGKEYIVQWDKEE